MAADEMGKAGTQRCIAEVVAERAFRQIVYQCVGTAKQILKREPPVFCIEREHERVLATIMDRIGRVVALDIAAWWLDPHDIGTGFG